MVKEFLSERKILFEERDVSRDAAAAQEMVNRTGQRGVPVTIIDGQVIVGFDRPRLEQALGNYSRARPVFGAAIADAGRVKALYGTGITAGVYIGRVSPGSAAEKMGLSPGDVILEVNQQHITNADDMENMVSHLNRGDRITVVYLRNNRTTTAEGAF